MKFIDSTEIQVVAGRGGDGAVSFQRARFRPKLGPDGGNGGNGGDVVLQGTGALNTLGCVRYRQSFKAECGGAGGSHNKTGRCGDDLVIRLPYGTIVCDVESGRRIGELLPDSDRFVIARGGKRGYGNLQFTSSTRRAPQYATQGQPGQSKSLRLELKVIADVGLAGAPNAGKSTLLSCLSNARPKIANYPFTTLSPNIGIVEAGERSFVLADVPGLLPQASIGRGLGLKFLRHLERTRVIAVVIDLYACQSEGTDVSQAYENIVQELASYSGNLSDKVAMVILNKSDSVDSEFADEQMRVARGLVSEVALVSGVTGAGLDQLRYRISALVERAS